MSAAEWIAKRRELLASATEGPWFQDADDPGLVWGEQRSDGDGYWSLFASETGHDATAEPSDAALIADARTSLPIAVDALEAVLALADNPYPDARNISGADIKRAIKYATLEAAKANCCGDERCVRLESEVE